MANKNFKKEMNLLRKDLTDAILAQLKDYEDNDVLILDHEITDPTVISTYRVTGVFHDEINNVFVLTNFVNAQNAIELDGFSVDNLVEIYGAIRYAKADKVFVLTKVDVSEDCGETITTGVYKTREAAQKVFNSMKEEIKKNSDLWDEDSPAFEDFTDTDTEFTVWEDGYYNNNHVAISIQECVIDE